MLPRFDTKKHFFKTNWLDHLMGWLGFYSWDCFVATQQLIGDVNEQLSIRWLTVDEHFEMTQPVNTYQQLILDLKAGRAMRMSDAHRGLRARLERKRIQDKASSCLAFRQLIGAFNDPDQWLRWQQAGDDLEAIQQLYQQWQSCSDVGGMGLRSVVVLWQALQTLSAHTTRVKALSWWQRWWLGETFFDDYMRYQQHMLTQLTSLRAQCESYLYDAIVASPDASLRHPMWYFVNRLQKAGVDGVCLPAELPMDHDSSILSQQAHQIVAFSKHGDALLSHYANRPLRYGIWCQRWVLMPDGVYDALKQTGAPYQSAIARWLLPWIGARYAALDDLSRQLDQPLCVRDMDEAWQVLDDLRQWRGRYQTLLRDIEQEKNCQRAHNDRLLVLQHWHHYINQQIESIDQRCVETMTFMLRWMESGSWHWLDQGDACEGYITLWRLAARDLHDSVTTQNDEWKASVHSAAACGMRSQQLIALFAKDAWDEADCETMLGAVDDAVRESGECASELAFVRLRLDRVQAECTKRFHQLSTMPSEKRQASEVIVSECICLVDVLLQVADEQWVSQPMVALLMAWLHWHIDQPYPDQVAMDHMDRVAKMLTEYVAEDRVGGIILADRMDALNQLRLEGSSAWPRCGVQARLLLDDVYQHRMSNTLQTFSEQMDARMLRHFAMASLSASEWLPWLKQLGKQYASVPMDVKSLSVSDQVVVKDLSSRIPVRAMMRLQSMLCMLVKTWCDGAMHLEERWALTVNYLQCMRDVVGVEDLCPLDGLQSIESIMPVAHCHDDRQLAPMVGVGRLAL